MNVGYQAQQTYTIPKTTHQPSPPDSISMPPTPSDDSPTSPRFHQYLQYRQPNPYKQIKDPRTPLYVPAVLRPTERYPKISPLTPPKSLRGSLDSLEAHHQGDTVDDPHPLDPVLENDYFPEEELGEVTGPPTKEHWKPDSLSPTCDSPTCRSTFTIFTRKHHCRHCGHIFCGPHTSHSITLNQDAKFHPSGFPSKACETCTRQFQLWSSVRKRRESGLSRTSDPCAEGEDGSGETTLLHPHHHQRGGSASVLMKGPAKQQGTLGKMGMPMGGSAPKDWMWSTF